MYNRKKSLTITGVSLVINLVVFYLIAWRCGAEHPFGYAFALLFSIFIHELGHALVLEWNGIKTNMVFLFIGAGVGAGEEYREKEKSLNSSTKSLLYLAGVMGNMFLVIAGVLAMSIGLIPEEHALRFINLNAGLIFWNLLPIGPLDGGRFILMFFESIKESEEKAYAAALTAVSICSVLAISFATGQSLLFPLVLLVYGIKKKSDQDDPKAYYSRKRLTAKNRFVWTSIWLALLILGCSIGYSTPVFIASK